MQFLQQTLPRLQEYIASNYPENNEYNKNAVGIVFNDYLKNVIGRVCWSRLASKFHPVSHNHICGFVSGKRINSWYFRTLNTFRFFLWI